MALIAPHQNHGQISINTYTNSRYRNIPFYLVYCVGSSNIVIVQDTITLYSSNLTPVIVISILPTIKMKHAKLDFSKWFLCSTLQLAALNLLTSKH